MKISEEIEAKINEVESFENCQLSPLWNDGYISGLRKAKKIVVAHESKYGWQPIETAPMEKWLLVRCRKSSNPFFNAWLSDEFGWCTDSAQPGATEWYKFEDEED